MSLCDFVMVDTGHLIFVKTQEVWHTVSLHLPGRLCNTKSRCSMNSAEVCEEERAERTADGATASPMNVSEIGTLKRHHSFVVLSTISRLV